MEIKKGLGLILLVLGIVTTVEAKRTALRSMDDTNSADDEPVMVKKQSVKTVKVSVASSNNSSEKISQKKSSNKKMDQSKKGPFCCYFDITPATENAAKKLYVDLAVGMIKYNMPTITLINAIGGHDTVSLEHSSLLPMIRGGMGVELIGVPCCKFHDDEEDKTTRARVGWQVLYAKKNGAIETYYTNTGHTTPNLLGLQDVERGEFMAVFSYDLLRDKFSIEGGLGVVGGALKDFELFQPAATGSTVIEPSLYTGQRLTPRKAAFGGFVGANLAHRFKTADRVLVEFGYRAVFSSVHYRTTIYQDQPGSYANQIYQNGFSVSQTAGNAVLSVEPKFKVRAQEITFGVVAEF